jgi:FkbM family methyltransferase
MRRGLIAPSSIASTLPPAAARECRGRSRVEPPIRLLLPAEPWERQVKNSLAALRTLWHPHQKLWNWDLADTLKDSGHVRLAGWLIPVDSVLLAVRVLFRRAVRLGPFAFRRKAKSSMRVLYVDCGVHTEGMQIRLFHEWFSGLVNLQILAFEASPRHFPEATANLADIPNLDLRNIALVGPDFGSPTIKLYRTGGNGKGDSLFSERGHEFDEVPTGRLSDFIRETPADLVILRMNIEGAEEYVIEDLVDAGALDRIAAFYGMWDDLSKIDANRDKAFRDVLHRHGVRTLTFNDRDARHPLRHWAIRLDIDTVLQLGKQGGHPVKTSFPEHP